MSGKEMETRNTHFVQATNKKDQRKHIIEPFRF